MNPEFDPCDKCGFVPALLIDCPDGKSYCAECYASLFRLDMVEEDEDRYGGPGGTQPCEDCGKQIGVGWVVCADCRQHR